MTAVPVPTHHHNIAMVGVMDIVVHAVEVFDALPDDAKIKSKFADVATEQLLSNTSRTPYRALYLDTSVKELLQTMAELRMHDLAISDRSNNIVAVINEYEVMRCVRCSMLCTKSLMILLQLPCACRAPLCTLVNDAGRLQLRL